ncbi:hypothetical protein LTR53_011812 [Teratosphaeriaceae sp. CCFEE 6253]|nr:hypothetical protein LTR53_011812 [Teratosphaeriaceae sp. CCFEE 6253]
MNTEELRGHTQVKRHQADSDQDLQYSNGVASTPDLIDSLPNHLSTLSFPTLSPDGSVDDINSLPTRDKPLASPAALSPRGAVHKRDMAQPDAMTDSASSFADSQYDMVDDLSEISSEDHDTASLASTEHAESVDGDEGSDDVEAPAADEKAQQDDTLVDSLVESENEHDEGSVNSEEDHSYLSEDLETPRQSTIPKLFERLRKTRLETRASPITGIHQVTSLRPLRVLLIAERGISELEKHRLCAKLASSTASNGSGSLRCRVTTLPLTPTGISPSSAVTYSLGNICVEIQHCVGTEIKDEPQDPEGILSRSRTYIALHFLDADLEHSSVYRIGKGLKPELERPDMAVIYNTAVGQHKSWIATARSAMDMLSVPTLAVDSYDLGSFDGSAYHALDISVLLNMDRADLHQLIDDVLQHRPIRRRRLPFVTLPSMSQRGWTSREAWKARKWSASASLSSMMLLLMGMAMLLQLCLPLFGQDAMAEHASRRTALSSAVHDIADSSEATKSFNYDHILPQPVATATDIFGRILYSTSSEVRYAPLAPNHIIVAVPRQSSNFFGRKIQATRARKGSREIACNHTRIIDGVFDIAIDLVEAYGTVEVEGAITHPKSAFSIQHNFGNRLLQRQTYAQARTDISRSVTKDIALASDTAKTLGERLHMELLAGAVATKNVTTEIAVQMTRDLQVFAHAAASLAGKVPRALNSTAHVVVKDLILVQHEVAKLGRTLQRSYNVTKQTALALVPTKKTVTSPLKLSHKRAVGFRQKLFGGKDTNNTCAPKALSAHRLHEMVKSLTPAHHFAKLLSRRGPTSLSTVPGKGVTSCSKKACSGSCKKRTDGSKAGKSVKDGAKKVFSDKRNSSEKKTSSGKKAV